MPIANARMYSVTAPVGAAWRGLLGWVLERAGLDWAVIDHAAPAPLSALWSRQDLGAVMMCGFPYSRCHPRPILIAAPLPSPRRYRRRPIYFTDIVVRADSPYRSLQDTFGGIVGYTLRDSMSGCIALRRHLQRYRSPSRQRLYRQAVGGLVNAQGVIEALASGRIDVGPLDSYSHDLLRQDAPALTDGIRLVETTDAAPIPPLIATAALSGPQIERLKEALRAAGSASELAGLRDRLLLAGFAFPAADDYDVLTNAGNLPADEFEESP